VGRKCVGKELRAAFPHDSAPGYLIFDRGPQFNSEVIETVKNLSIQPKRISFRSPWQNDIAERWGRKLPPRFARPRDRIQRTRLETAHA
jgi:hypothetical protein